MTITKSERFAATFQKLRLEYIAQLASEHRRLLELAESEPSDRVRADTAEVLHRIGGGAASFGLEQLSALAIRAEEALANGGPDDPLQLLIKRLQEVTSELT